MMVAQNAKNVMEPQVQLRQFFIKNTFPIFCERCFALVANLANYTLKICELQKEKSRKKHPYFNRLQTFLQVLRSIGQ